MITPKIWTKEHLSDYLYLNRDLINVKESERYPGLKVLKYKNKVFYKALWTPEICEFRGTVVDEDFNIVLRPPTKVFNYQEMGSTFPDDLEVVAHRKVNGFLAHCTIFEDEFIVGTSGSLDSDFAVLARAWLEPFEQCIRDSKYAHYTHIFEIVDWKDPHIIQEPQGAYLLAVRRPSWNASSSLLSPSAIKQYAESFNRLDCLLRANRILTSESELTTFGDIKLKVRGVRHEGYMVTEPLTGHQLKLKSPYYLTIKFLGRMGDKNLNHLFEDPEGFKQKIDEEFYELVDYISMNRSAYVEMTQQQRLYWLSAYFDRTLTF